MIRHGILLIAAAMPISLAAQTLTTLFAFDSKDGWSPQAVVQDAGGHLYGPTLSGGSATSYGTVFKLAPGGTLTTLYRFCPQTPCSGGQAPFAGLIQAADGNFYGTTTGGGAYLNCFTDNGESIGCGTVFKITPTGDFVTLYSFCPRPRCEDGSAPYTGLVQAANGDLYGATQAGGGGCEETGCGTIYKITTAGVLTTLHRFTCPNNGPCTGGAVPIGGLVVSASGDLYGTTSSGGAYGNQGTIFRLAGDGSLTTLYSFCAQSGCPDGENPRAPLIQAADGNFYGTTSGGGAYGGGTVFKVTAGGALTNLYSFCVQPACADGAYPVTPLVQATDGALYGTTSSSGANGFGTAYGTIFKITPDGEMTTLYSFCSLKNCADGQSPGPLIQGANGALYGVTAAGGMICGETGGCGTVFRFSLP